MTEITSGTGQRSLAANLSVKTVLAKIHLWIGITCCIPFVLIGISGSLWMLVRDLPYRFDPAAIPARPISEIVDAAGGAVSSDMRLVGYDAPNKPGQPAIVRFASSAAGGGTGRPAAGPRIAVDLETLAAAPAAPPASARFARLMHDVHGNLLVPGLGRTIVGWLGVFMVFLGLSGMVMWWPAKKQWKSAFTVKFGQSALKVNRDLHGAVGIWGWIVFVLVCLSGVYICFSRPINQALDAHLLPRQVAVAPVDGQTPATVDEAAALAAGAVPGGLVRVVNVPAQPDQPYRIQLSRAGDYDGVPRAMVAVDPWQRTVVDVRDPQTYPALETVLSYQRQFHGGHTLALWWWILVFLSGFLPLIFVVSGISMWWLKRRNKARVRAQA